ncbi:hypothetical protein ACI76W_02795 [Capnocytophaga canimorsus]|uniref:hypothetical protein n=1 Tax=Capnocytophaga canimorsus TaxID=28188 RepID=UPI00385EEA32
MKNTLLITLLLLTFKLYAQISERALFVIFDDTDGVLRTQKEEINSGETYWLDITKHYKHHKVFERFDKNNKLFYKSIEYDYKNDKEDWLLNISHIIKVQNSDKYSVIKRDHILLIPNEHLDFLKDMRQVKTIAQLEEIWNTLSQETYDFFFDGYAYIYKIPPFVKHHIFVIFSSDLQKDYIPCYQVRVHPSNIQYE